ncbi:hypothetical protein B0H14DRAFT_159229 [Mycena olivaceomarginata]|nr:hypothetical protein B0H14DRAFT_159229 [Mycena olivaceomarginata]
MTSPRPSQAGASPSSTESPSALRVRLAELDEEKDALESRLRFLANERRKIVHGLNAVKYPVLTLPQEITSEIFTHYVHDPHLGRPGRDPQGRGPLALAGVCRSWRDICFTTCTLWASLRIYPDRFRVDDFIHLLECWLQRAGNHPLDLHIFGCAKPESTIPMKIFGAISHYSSRIRTFSFTLDTPYSFPNAKIQGRLPLLTKLDVNIIADELDCPRFMTAFSDAPHLRQVRLAGASIQWISLPWIQLTHLEITDVSVSSCLQILKQTPNLEVLDVFLPQPDTELEPLALRPLALPHLHTLTFSYDPEGGLLACLILPALRTLHLRALKRDGPSRFLALGARSAWSLRLISLKDMRAADCAVCLRSLPSVTEVEIDVPYDQPTQLISLLREDSTFLPAVHALTIRDCGPEISLSLLTDMLESRSTGGHEGMAKLEYFRIFLSPDVSEAYEEEIRARLRPLTDVELGFIDSPRPFRR